MLFKKENGKFSGESIKEAIESLPDGRYKMDIESLDTRTERQNAYLWWWIYPQAVELYRDSWLPVRDKDIHLYYKQEFLRKRKKCIVSKRYRMVVGSTATLSKKDFKRYIEQINEDCVSKFSKGLLLNTDIYVL